MAAWRSRPPSASCCRGHSGQGTWKAASRSSATPRAGQKHPSGIIRSVPERGRLYRTEAVILRRQDLGETDRLLTLFSPAQGKLRVVAKGVRRPGSRKAGHLEPFSRVDLLLARGRELDVITQAEAVSLYPHLREDL